MKSEYRYKGYQFNSDGSVTKILNKQRSIEREIAEKVLGRKLRSVECVHHIDRNRKNNQYSNLLICTWKYHGFLHRRMRYGKESVRAKETLELILQILKSCYSVPRGTIKELKNKLQIT